MVYTHPWPRPGRSMHHPGAQDGPSWAGWRCARRGRAAACQAALPARADRSARRALLSRNNTAGFAHCAGLSTCGPGPGVGMGRSTFGWDRSTFWVGPFYFLVGPFYFWVGPFYVWVGPFCFWVGPFLLFGWWDRYTFCWDRSTFRRDRSAAFMTSHARANTHARN